MAILELRSEFQTQHMRATAIELSNRQNTGWAQKKDANEILEITYPSSDIRRALEAVPVRMLELPTPFRLGELRA